MNHIRFNHQVLVDEHGIVPANHLAPVAVAVAAAATVIVATVIRSMARMVTALTLMKRRVMTRSLLMIGINAPDWLESVPGTVLKY